MRGSRNRPLVAVLGLLGLLPSCAWLTTDASQNAVQVPAAVVAAITSAALRDELNAEPLSAHAGAPVTARVDGSFDVEYTRDARGRWLPRGSLRLTIAYDERSGFAGVRERRLLAQELPGFGGRAVARLTVHIEPTADGCRVHSSLPAAVAPRLQPLIDRTLVLATSHEREGPGLLEPNLAAWRIGVLLRLAREATIDRPSDASSLLSRAARLPNAPAVVHEHIAALQLAHGDELAAQIEFRRALLHCRDPLRRAALCKRAAAAERRVTHPTRLRSDAVDHLNANGFATAETLLHSARRLTPEPVVDYYLLARVHNARGDELGEMAARLLSREYDPTPDTDPNRIDRDWQRHLREWSRRLTLGIDPLIASSRVASSPGR